MQTATERSCVAAVGMCSVLVAIVRKRKPSGWKSTAFHDQKLQLEQLLVVGET